MPTTNHAVNKNNKPSTPATLSSAAATAIHYINIINIRCHLVQAQFEHPVFLPKSAMEKDDDCGGLVTQANAFIKQYTVEVKRISIDLMCVHPVNRGGVYPNVARVQTLAADLMKAGFDAKEANHNGICVKDFSEEARPQGYETFKEFNCKNCEMLVEFKLCFDRTKDVCVYGLLSHNHLLLVFKCILRQAALVWPERFAPLLTKPGGISLEELNLKLPGLGDILRDGLEMTVLRPEIMTEHPHACSIISQALNKGHSLSCPTSETTAMKVIADYISRQIPVGGAVMEKASFKAVKDRMRHELDEFVESDEFIDMYQFCLDQGGGTSPHMEFLIKFFQTYVDSRRKRVQIS